MIDDEVNQRLDALQERMDNHCHPTGRYGDAHTGDAVFAPPNVPPAADDDAAKWIEPLAELNRIVRDSVIGNNALKRQGDTCSRVSNHNTEEFYQRLKHHDAVLAELRERFDQHSHTYQEWHGGYPETSPGTEDSETSGPNPAPIISVPPAADDDAAKWDAVLRVFDNTVPMMANEDIKAAVAKAIELGLVPRRELVVSDALVVAWHAWQESFDMRDKDQGRRVHAMVTALARHWSGEEETE